MNINSENLSKVKSAFETKIETGKMGIDSEYPFFNAYDYKGEIVFSMPHKFYNMATEYADQEFYKEIPETWNTPRNSVKWLGVLDTSRFFLVK